MLKSFKLRPIIFGAVAITCAGVGAYMMKSTAIDRTQELREITAQIEEEKDRITVLEADWSYLTRPSRIQHLSREMLSFAPVAAERILTLNALEHRNDSDDTELFQIKEIKGLE